MFKSFRTEMDTSKSGATKYCNSFHGNRTWGERAKKKVRVNASVTTVDAMREEGIVLWSIFYELPQKHLTILS